MNKITKGLTKTVTLILCMEIINFPSLVRHVIKDQQYKLH